MPDCIKLNEGNIDVCEREVIALREIIAAAMGRLHQMRKQCERGYASSEDFENALDVYGVIRGRVDELDQLVLGAAFAPEGEDVVFAHDEDTQGGR